MASDELRAALGNDPSLMAVGEDLAMRIARNEPELRSALETGELEIVAAALGMDQPELEALGRFFYERAQELAERFPEISRQAARWGAEEPPF